MADLTGQGSILIVEDDGPCSPCPQGRGGGGPARSSSAGRTPIAPALPCRGPARHSMGAVSYTNLTSAGDQQRADRRALGPAHSLRGSHRATARHRYGQVPRTAVWARPPTRTLLERVERGRSGGVGAPGLRGRARLGRRAGGGFARQGILASSRRSLPAPAGGAGFAASTTPRCRTGVVPSARDRRGSDANIPACDTRRVCCRRRFVEFWEEAAFGDCCGGVLRQARTVTPGVADRPVSRRTECPGRSKPRPVILVERLQQRPSLLHPSALGGAWVVAAS